MEHLCQIPCSAMPIISEADSGKAIKPIIHPNRVADFHVLIYMIHGEMEVIEDGVTHTLTPNTLFFLKKGIHHWGEKPFSMDASWFYVHFSCASSPKPTIEIPSMHIFTESALNSTLLDYHLTMPKRLEFDASNQIYQRIKQIISYHNTGNMMQSALLLWETLLTAYRQKTHRDWTAADTAKIDKVIAYLDNHYPYKLSHDALQQMTQLSYKYLSTLFKQRMGVTIKQYQLVLRLKKSIELLCETNMPISEIAHQTGFYDEFYFSKTFKREYGVSPLRYRMTYTPKI